MKIKDIKRDKSNYKTIKSEKDIDEIIEAPLRDPIKEFNRKNIITIMSSANEINVKWLDEDGNDMYQTKRDFDAVKFSYGNGFAYIILDYDSLSDENKAIMNKLYDELNPSEIKSTYEKPITAEQTYKGNKRIIYAVHQKEIPFHAWKIDSEETYQLLTHEPEDNTEKEFFERSNFVYTTPYSERSVIIRYPVTEETQDKDVEKYFLEICSRLKEQEKRFTIDEMVQSSEQFIEKDKSRLNEIAKNLFRNKNKKMIFQPYTGQLLITENDRKEIITKYIEEEKNFMIYLLSSRITDEMTDEQKYKVIFDYFINKYKYDYSILDSEKALDYFRTAFYSYRKILKTYIDSIENYNSMTNFERAQKIIGRIPRDEENHDLLELMENAQRYYERAQDFKSVSRNYRGGNLFISHYGVCQNFSMAFKEICDNFNLPCECVEGHILSDGINVGHAWNAIVVDDEIKFVDISSAIHSKDGTYPNNEPEDFFNVDEQQLNLHDNGKNRTLTEDAKEKILEMQKKIKPFNPNGGGNMTIQNDITNGQKLDNDMLSLD